MLSAPASTPRVASSVAVSRTAARSPAAIAPSSSADRAPYAWPAKVNTPANRSYRCASGVMSSAVGAPGSVPNRPAPQSTSQSQPDLHLSRRARFVEADEGLFGVEHDANSGGPC
jgi:hypothetical protein